jgi:hypothetical protein
MHGYAGGVLYVSYYTWLFLFVVQHETNTLTFSSPLIHTLSKPYPVTKNVNTCDWLIVSLFVWMIDWLTLNEQYLSYNQWASGCCFTLTQQFFSYILARTMCGRSWVWAWSGQTKDYVIGICCFSTKQAALRRKSKDWFVRNQDN